MKLVIKIGGSVIASPLNAELIVSYSRILRVLKEKGHQVVVVVGGGEMAREFISVAEGIGLSDDQKDEIAISVSRLNARLIALALGDDSSRDIPTTSREVVKALTEGKIVVMGGLKPGITTDTVAAIVMESIKAGFLVKATDQEGIYDADPRKYPNAKKLEKLTYSDLRNIVQRSYKPGMHGIMDVESIEILEKRKARLVVVNGLKPENVLAAVTGAKIGTIVETR